MILVNFQKCTDIKKHIITGSGLLDMGGRADRKVLLTDIGRKIVKDIDGGIVISKDNIGIPKYDTSIPPSELSGGCQSLIYLLSNPTRPIRLECFGDNCYKYIWEISKIVDYDLDFIATGVGTPIFDFMPEEAFIVCKDNGKIIRDYFDFMDTRREFVKYEWDT